MIQWSNGCEQSLLRNYSLAYTAGYHKSTEECMMCHHVQGPFVAKTELLKTVSKKEMQVEMRITICKATFHNQQPYDQAVLLLHDVSIDLESFAVDGNHQ